MAGVWKKTEAWEKTVRGAITGEIETDPRRRAEYSSDASNYRVLPRAVVFPRDAADVSATLDIARTHGLAVTARGAGTSVAGNAIGPGLVLDFSRHMNAILELDPEQRIARVQPGVVLSTLQRQAAAHGLRFGPDPSTQNRCTMGGMIGNNACGPHAVAWGRTSDTVRRLRILDGRGLERVLTDDLSAIAGLPEFTRNRMALIRTELGRFERQASGYALEHLLPERGSSIAKAFVGTEGTCGLLLEATVDLVPVPAATVLVLLGYPDMPTAADDIAAVMAVRPLAVEGMDARLVDVVRTHRGAVPDLPRGGGWLLIEIDGADPHEARDKAELLRSRAHALDSRIVTDQAEARALWSIRADGAGLAGRTPDGNPAWPGWEDAAVPPDRLGDYLRDFDALMREHGLDGLLYGHFGDGCIHVRLDLPIADAPQRFRAFLEDAARQVVKFDGSLSGEHGDGRARSELLRHMYSPQALDAFAEFKALFDPEDVLNPGVLVQPRPIDADLRLAGLRPLPTTGGFAFPADGGLATAVHRCVGVGKCRADNHASGGFMCPSYLATADEKDSTRGRARVLQEVVRGALDWRSEAVAESLDLCLSCKACHSDCPAGVDMATYKSETLYRRYQGRRRPMDHYSLGRLPRWLAAASRAPRLANLLGTAGPLRRTGLRLAGMDPRRAVPTLAHKSFRRSWRPSAPTAPGADVPTPGSDVMLWIDTFTDAFDPEIARATVTVIESLGHRVTIPERRVCCGLTWISTGQLDDARKRLRATVDALADHVGAGGVVVGLEPSCTAALREDLPRLLPDDPRAAAVARAVHTLSEFLETQPDWQPPDRSGHTVLVQPHCHQHAVLGFDADRRILRRTGATVTEITGCCGLAGNFGMQRGHYDVSVAVAENGLLPALRAAPEKTILLADGFSCRTQAEQLAGRRFRHLAQFLLEDGPPRMTR
ncbi:FAD-binding and (Fe-S)-binding domain-containing protein [Nocardia sp. CDC160]|uniref:FAD-binding and (Fe-S)-binding domain-containing protein n=1 Tax=Nocardia sp. CDC160 TaxID=3112166 RepID=UPI002DBC7BA2|nr:FAD-binding and (Fe-S)-binding domain-containing protein [Nocardia sp. CDC160]MEC3914226.1 FAD-binding and (Fe-S)-binding domain-containing protein [Nocardia sp. CDC160]